jgi:hypothetical protein
VLPRLGPFGPYYVLYYTVGVRNGPSCISRATSTSPTGPFVDDSSGPSPALRTVMPVFASVGTIAGPGGQELFTDGTGQLWMAYHAYSPSSPSS